MFDPTSSDFAGVPEPTLRQWLFQAQQALHELSTGEKGESYSYTQGDGAKSVTYSRANIGMLTAHIAALKAQLGIGGGRRPLRFRFR